MRKKAYFLSVCILLLLKGFSQYDTPYNPIWNLIALNPSFAGSNSGIRVQTAASYQPFGSEWGGRELYSFNTYNSADAYIRQIGAGVSFFHRASNILYLDGKYIQQYGGSYAQHVSLFKGRLVVSPSVQLGNNVSYYYKSYYWPSQTLISETTPWLGAGLLFKIRNVYVGISQNNVTLPWIDKKDKYSQRPASSLYLSHNIALSKWAKINYSLILSDNGPGSGNIQINLNALFVQKVILSVTHALHDRTIFGAGYRDDYFTVQFGYGIAGTQLAGYTYGIWQGAASFNLRNKEKRKQVTSFEEW